MNSDVLKLFRYRDACYIMKSRRDPVTWILHQYMLYKLISAWRDDENLFESVKDYASFTDNDMIKTLFAGLVIGSLFRSGRPLVNDNNITSYLRSANETHINNRISRNIVNDKRISNDIGVTWKLRNLTQQLNKFLIPHQIQHAENMADQVLRTTKVTSKMAINVVREYVKRGTGRFKDFDAIRRSKIRTEQLQRNFHMTIDQTVDYHKMQLLPNRWKPARKIWVWHPNEATRHSSMSGATVDLDEDFKVVSDAGRCPIAYMRFPHDSHAPVCQTANCYCTVRYECI